MKMIGLGKTSSERHHRAEPEEPHPGRHRGHRAPTVERHDGHQVEEVEEEADVGERAQQVAVDGLAYAPADGRAGGAEDRPREPYPGLG